MKRVCLLTALSLATALAVTAPSMRAAQTSPGAGPVIVLDTAKGVVDLVKKGFYNGLRFHRAEANFLVQIGDPKSRDMSLREWWGRYGSGKPVGVAEITKKRRNLKGAVGMAHSGSAKDADSQFYITMRVAPELDAKFTVFGQVIKGLDVVAKLQKADVLKKASVRE